MIAEEKWYVMFLCYYGWFIFNTSGPDLNLVIGAICGIHCAGQQDTGLLVLELNKTGLPISRYYPVTAMGWWEESKDDPCTEKWADSCFYKTWKPKWDEVHVVCFRRKPLIKKHRRRAEGIVTVMPLFTTVTKYRNRGRTKSLKNNSPLYFSFHWEISHHKEI